MMTKSVRRTVAKVYRSAEEAIADIPSYAFLATGGFGYRGVPDSLLSALTHSQSTDFRLIACDVFGLEPLLLAGKIKDFTASYILQADLQRLMNLGKITVRITPMGTVAEKLRSGGAGIPAFYTKTGVGSWVETGEIPIRFKDGEAVEFSNPKERREFNGEAYIYEESVRPDFGLIRAWKADSLGNLIYKNVAQNFNPLVAKAAKITIAEVEEIVPAGSLRPEAIHTPGAYVHRLVLGSASPGILERPHISSELDHQKMKIAKRAAKEILPGMSVNLGIGLPTLLTPYIDPSAHIQSENGLLRMGPASAHPVFDLVNAGRQPVSLLPGGSFFDSAESFAMIRGGHIDVSFLGAFQVSKSGDIANWAIPGKRVVGMGGAMDLVNSGSRIVVVMSHMSEAGELRLLGNCSLPITGKSVVQTVITDLCMFRLDKFQDPVLEETAAGVDISTIQRKTGFRFQVSPTLRKDVY